MMTFTTCNPGRLIFATAMLLGFMAVFWMGGVFYHSSALALAVTLAIGVIYAIGVTELIGFRRATRTLSAALSKTDLDAAALADWLDGLDASLHNAVRSRIEGERVGLPAPVLTPYLVGLLVMLGLLGTFIGMVDTLKGAVIALEGTTELSAIRAGLAAPIKGLGLAFGTSVAGVATSAMLGLMSTLSRRDRMLATRRLDTLIPTVFKRHSRVHAQQETFEALQLQSRVLPEVAHRLDAMSDRLERLGEVLAAGQERFHESASQIFTELADSLDKTHKESLAENTRLAGESIRPIVEGVMASVAEGAETVHRQLARTAQDHLDAVSGQLSEFSAGMNRSIETTLEEQRRANGRLIEQMHGALEDFKARFEMTADALGDGFNAMVADLDSQWRQAGEVAAAREEQTASAFKKTMASVTQDMRTAADEMRSSMGNLSASSEALVQARIDSEAEWLSAHQERMKELAQVIRSELLALRNDEEARGQAAVERLARLESVLATHLAALGNGLEAPMARLIETAAEAPRAAAEVIEHLRREAAGRIEEDTRRLEAQAHLISEIDSLSRSLYQTSTEQRAAIEDLVASSKTVMEQTVQRFHERMDAEAGRLTQTAQHFAGSAAEMASLGDAFGAAVTLFTESNDQMIENLQRIEAALEKASARSDDQLAYYVAQAREIIDYCMLSQKDIIEDLQKLQQNNDTAMAG